MSLNCLKEELEKNNSARRNLQALAKSFQRTTASSAVLLLCNSEEELESYTKLYSKILICKNQLCSCSECMICLEIDDNIEAPRLRSVDYQTIVRDGGIEKMREALYSLNQYGGHSERYLQIFKNIDKTPHRRYRDILLSFLEHPNPNISYLVTACSVFAIPGVITSRCERILFESDKSTKDSLLHQKALLKKDEKLFEDSLQTLKIALRDGFDYDNFLSLYGDFKLLHSETQSEAQFCRELLLLLYSICRSLYMKKLHANYDFTLLIKENLESELSSLSFNDLSTLIERYELTLPTLNSFTFLDALNFIESVLGDKKSKTMI